MDINRSVRVWGLLADEARRRGGPLSVGVACHAAARVLSAEGVSVATVAPGDVYVSVFATNGLGRRLEELQSTLGEGPGLQSYVDGAPVLTSDLDTGDKRWPLFGSGAVEMGVRALFAFPLRSGTVSIGVFEVHRGGPGPMTPVELGDALVLADVISILLLSPESSGGRDFIDDAISSDHHAEVYQATGMVSVHLGVSLADALARLRGYAFVHSQSISAVAHEIVLGRLRLDESETDD
ncbi:GAF and ANTAR domain-containing protein [Actinomadura sp. DC4]|uniref:GAF and ANTAR domain-containing protein n=1 Tax=Actinomadura sp. DC4 TaxID=3055069 RepID=UPI0025AF3588|nr:GAF and ANTAR domain-containing protein [Actinomadura sp. DC4]MDN3357829.1 GAF and ANTAR domain-containing protein [Actinomadura sp. DC4]